MVNLNFRLLLQKSTFQVFRVLKVWNFGGRMRRHSRSENLEGFIFWFGVGIVSLVLLLILTAVRLEADNNRGVWECLCHYRNECVQLPGASNFLARAQMFKREWWWRGFSACNGLTNLIWDGPVGSVFTGLACQLQLAEVYDLRGNSTGTNPACSTCGCVGDGSFTVYASNYPGWGGVYTLPVVRSPQRCVLGGCSWESGVLSNAVDPFGRDVEYRFSYTRKAFGGYRVGLCLTRYEYGHYSSVSWWQNYSDYGGFSCAGFTDVGVPTSDLNGDPDFGTGVVWVVKGCDCQ